MVDEALYETDEMGRPIVPGYRWVYSRSRDGKTSAGYGSTTFSVHDFGLHTRMKIARDTKPVYRRLERLNRYIRRSEDPKFVRMMSVAIRVLRQFTGSMGVDESVGVLLRKVESLDVEKVRWSSVVAAAVYTALRMHGYPVSLDDVVERVCAYMRCGDSRSTRREVWRVIMALQTEAGVRYDVRRVVANYISRLCGDRPETMAVAARLLQEMSVAGMRPDVAAAALCVLASAITGDYGYHVDAANMSRRAGCSDAAVRRAVGVLLERFEVVAWLG